jgi:DNA-directed RNA polymerase specialized sigma24 family protein
LIRWVTNLLTWNTHEKNIMISDDQLLQGLKQKEEKSIYEVYNNFFPSVEKYVLMNSGSEQDAEDVFQDTVMILLSYVAREGFHLTSALKTLVFAIARKLWLKQLRNRSRCEILTELEMSQCDFLTDWEEIEKSEKRYNSLPQVLSRISEHCSGLLKQLFLTGKIPDHYKNDHSMRNQKYKCLEQARKMIVKLSDA